MKTHLLSALVSSLGLLAVPLGAEELTLDLGAQVELPLVRVKAGTFMQGSPQDEPGRDADEAQRQVTLTKDFYIGRHVVTRGQFARFVEATRYRTEAEKGTSGGYGVVKGELVQRSNFTWKNPGFEQSDEHPVVMVTYQDALAFCQWIKARTFREVNLPTEAQWEYACRAGTSEATYREPVDLVAWFRENAQAQTYRVGVKPGNAWGISDLYGPVWQWCRDWYAPYPEASITDPLQNNANLSDKPRRVLRGGSFLSGKSRSRSAERYRNDPKSRNADNGFRIVCSIDAAPPQAVAPSAQPRFAEPNPPQVKPGSLPVRRVIDLPVREAPEEPEGNMGFPFLGLSVFGGIVFFFIWIARKVWRAMSGSMKLGSAAGLTGQQMADRLSQQVTLGSPFRVQVTDSGFYIVGTLDQQGEQLTYSADVDGQTLSDEISFMPGPEGHFIFTGQRPTSVSVQTVGAGPVTHEPSFSSSSNTRHSSRDHRSNTRSFDSHPSAY